MAFSLLTYSQQPPQPAATTSCICNTMKNVAKYYPSEWHLLHYKGFLFGIGLGKWGLPAEALWDLSLPIQREQKRGVAIAAKALQEFFCCLKTFQSAALSLWHHCNGVKDEVLQAGGQLPCLEELSKRAALVGWGKSTRGTEHTVTSALSPVLPLKCFWIPASELFNKHLAENGSSNQWKLEELLPESEFSEHRNSTPLKYFKISPTYFMGLQWHCLFIVRL